ncbi:hypothetical protein FI667_g5303, partial [Globisporangium splendens]
MSSEARIENDYVPLAFLLGAKARHYSIGPSVVNDRRHHARTSPRSIAAPLAGSRAVDNVELFAPGAHVRHREDQARRCLRRVLGHMSSGDDSTEEKQSRERGTPPVYTASSLKKNTEKVLAEVSIMREEDEDERQKRQPSDGDDDQTRAAHCSHMAPLSFLDVSGRPAACFPLPSMTKGTTHTLTAKKKHELRVIRIQQLHALLQDQQAHTKELLKKQQLHELTSSVSNPGSRHIARVDLAVDVDVPHGAHGAVDTACLYKPPSLTAVKEQQQQEQQMLHERVQDRKHFETLMRQQKLAFYQQQKRTFGRIQSKRPSFLATLQLDKSHSLDHSQLDQSQQQEETRVKSVSMTENAQHLGYLSSRRKEDTTERRRDDSNDAGRFLEKQQRDTFADAKGIAGLHFGMAKSKKA